MFGITPFDNIRMLHFQDASAAGPTITRDESKVMQLVDVSSMAADIVAERLVAEVSAYFNRVSGDLETDTAFSVGIDALEGVPDLPQSENSGM